MKKPSAVKRLPSIRKSFNDRHPFVVPVVTLACLIVFSMVGFLVFGGQVVRPADAKVVSLYVAGKKQQIPTRAATVRELLERSQVELASEDLVEPSLDSPITGDDFSINIYRAKPVTVIDEGGKKVVAKIADTTPVVMASQAGYQLYPEDIVEIEDPDVALRQGVIGVQVVIDRATPIKMNLYGTTYDIRTHAETVAELAEERNLKIANQSILPALETKLKANDVVFVTDPGKQIVSTEEVIPNNEEVIQDQGLPVGETQVRTAGAPGKKVVVYEVSPDGKKVPLQEVVISNPVTRVVVKGRKVTAPNVSVAGDKATLMAQAGIPSTQHAAADFIISKESGWRPAARSANNCIGLGQRCNATILINACPNWETDAVCQLQHFNSYAVGRYGSWNEAYAFWSVNRWW